MCELSLEDKPPSYLESRDPPLPKGLAALLFAPECARPSHLLRPVPTRLASHLGLNVSFHVATCSGALNLTIHNRTDKRMSGKLAAARRHALAAEALILSVRGTSFTEIGKHLDISRQLASTLVSEELAKRAEHRDQDKERAIAHYEEIIRASWTRLEEARGRSFNAQVGFLNVSMGAQERIDKLTGAEEPIKLQNINDEYEVVFEEEEHVALRELDG